VDDGDDISARCAARPELSFRRSSLAMRSSPQVGFSLPMRRIRVCTCAGIGGRPGRDFRRQNSRQPARCQRIIVSGRTTTRASRQLKNRQSNASVTRLTGSTRRGQGALPPHRETTSPCQIGQYTCRTLLSSAIARRYSDIRYARRSTAPGEFNYCGGQVPQLCTMARLGVVSPPFGVPAHRHRFRARAFMPHHTHSWRLLCISAAAYCESPRSPGLAAVAGHLCWTYS